MIKMPAIETLTPIAFAADRRIACFPSGNTDLVKIDFLFEAGSAYQEQPLCASAASKLYSVATRSLSAAEMSEFVDFRGIIMETNSEVLQSSLTVYMLRRYVDEMLPMIKAMFEQPAFAEEDYRVWQTKRHEEIATLEHRTAPMARRLFYQALFGATHPLGRYATADDVYRLELHIVKDFWRRRYRLASCKVVAAGAVDDMLLDSLHGLLPTNYVDTVRMTLDNVLGIPTTKHLPMPGATQTSLRIGRLLPLSWDSIDYARFMILTTLLGGYFGSRLMRNIREDKGYTYGIYARTQIYRGCIVFYIVADVAAGTAEAAIQEVFNELRRLSDERVDDDELLLVKNVLVGDFLRSVDGVFELSGRYCDMIGTSVDERLTENLAAAIDETTAAQLQELAQRLLKVEDMTVCTAGV